MEWTNTPERGRLVEVGEVENAADGNGRCGVVVGSQNWKAGCCRRVAAATAAVLAASDV